MITTLYVNLPVADLARTRAFFTALGFDFDPRFSSDQTLCLIVNPQISCMLLLRPFFQGFTQLPVADAHAATQVLLALACESRAEVLQMVDRAVAAGGTTPNPAKDHGFMFQHGFADPDGHQWEVFWMDPNAHPAPEG
jgi:hypothetical protein